MATPVSVWAPAFHPYLETVSVENSQFTCRDGFRCKLCEGFVVGDRGAHARDHDRELKAWRLEQRRALSKRQREQLALINRERRLTQRVLAT